MEQYLGSESDVEKVVFENIFHIYEKTKMGCRLNFFGAKRSYKSILESKLRVPILVLKADVKTNILEN